MQYNLLFHTIDTKNFKDKKLIQLVPSTNFFYKSDVFSFFYNYSPLRIHSINQNISISIFFMLKIIPFEKLHDFLNFHLKKYVAINNYNTKLFFISKLINFISEMEKEINNKENKFITYNDIDSFLFSSITIGLHFDTKHIYKKDKTNINVIKKILIEYKNKFYDELFNYKAYKPSVLKNKILKKEIQVDSSPFKVEYKERFTNYLLYLLELNTKDYAEFFIIKNVNNNIELSCTNNSEKISEYKKRIKYFSDEIDPIAYRIIQQKDFYFYFGELVFPHKIMIDFCQNRPDINTVIFKNEEFKNILTTNQYVYAIKVFKEKIINLEQDSQKSIQTNKKDAPPVAVLALFYHYQMESGIIPYFENYPPKTKLQAMEYVLKKDGHNISTNNFKNTFYAIGKDNNKNPMTKKNVAKVLEILPLEAKKFAKKDFKSFNLQK